MERDFYNDDFEELIRDRSNQLKMYPTEKVWARIYDVLHTRKRRYVLGMSLLIASILILAGKQLLSPSKSALAKTEIGKNQKPEGPLAGPGESKQVPGPFVREKHVHLPLPLALSDDSNSTEDFSTSVAPNLLDSSATAFNNPAPAGLPDALGPVAFPEEFSTPHRSTLLSKTAALPDEPFAVGLAAIPQPLVDQKKLDLERDARKTLLEKYQAQDEAQRLWQQDRALQHLSPTREHKLFWQVYVSPVASYRTLSGGDYTNSRSTVQNVPISLVHYGNANDFVDHTPALGFEVGGSLQYRLTRNLRVKAGLQFNYSRYYIRAYHSAPELATIALNPIYGNFADSLTGYTSVRNFSGKYSEYLQNRYFSLSMPIGVEMRVLGNGRLQLNVGASVQPSYLLNTNAYLLTTDYTNYTKEPSLMRRWNVNGGLEAFLSYQMGSLRWQLGPQFRYQFFSTYSDKYPMGENLKEYGIKLGVIKSFR